MLALLAMRLKDLLVALHLIQRKSVCLHGILEDIKTQAAGLVRGGVTGITQQGLPRDARL